MYAYTKDNNRDNKCKTSVARISPMFEVLNGLFLYHRYVLAKPCNVQTGLQHLFLLQEDLHRKTTAVNNHKKLVNLIKIND